MTKNCLNCLRLFEVLPSRVERTKYCSKGCQERNREYLKTLPKVCNQCQIEKPLDAFLNYKRSGRKSIQIFSICFECNSTNVRTDEYKAKARPYRTAYHAKLRLEVISSLGGICACCGEKDYRFLAIDHIHGGGRQERKRHGGTQIFNHIKNQNFPKDLYQVLCHNCNFAKYAYGICPHQSKL